MSSRHLGKMIGELTSETLASNEHTGTGAQQKAASLVATSPRTGPSALATNAIFLGDERQKKKHKE